MNITSLLHHSPRLTAAAILLALLPAPATAFDPAAGDFSKISPDHIRVMTWNTHNNFIYTTADDGRYRRVISAAAPDILAMQEIDVSLTAAQIQTRLQAYFPGTTWHVYLGIADGSTAGVSNRNIIASRWPLSMKKNNTTPPSSLRGVTMALVNLPDATYSKDIYVMSVHFRAGNLIEDHESRQRHADAITNWMRDARTAGGEINLPNGTPMLVAGDVNLSPAGDKAPYHPSHTMRNGNIYNHTKYGPSSPPDWDGTDNSDAAPYDHSNGNPNTHNSSANPVGRIDRFYYTDSVMNVAAKFVINTQAMSDAARAAAGNLAAADTSGASDHLPSVVDFALGPSNPGALLVNEFCANDLNADDLSFIELANIGGEEINLDAPADYWIKTSLPLPTAPPTTENEEFAWDLKGVIPPGGLFALYDGAGESAGIKSTIESNLPKLQRQNFADLKLRNQDNTAFALVQRYIDNTTDESNIEAYGYGAPTPETTRYFRLNGGNKLMITLGPSQWTSHNSGEIGINDSLSRNPGNIAPNSYVNWTIGSELTPGQQNPLPSSIGNWTLY